MSRETFFGVLRHLLTFGGGFLVTSGVSTSSELDQAIGALCTLLGVLWSWYDKRSRLSVPAVPSVPSVPPTPPTPPT